MQQGYQTGRFGSRLARQVASSSAHSGWQVFYDHGDPTLDEHVAATKGFFGADIQNLNRLADIDILVASPDNIAQLLIEIEERPSPPKKLLGDALAILLCNRLAVRVHGEQRTFRISSVTRLIIAGVVPDSGYGRRKIDEVISPRLRRLDGFADGVAPKNVQFVFRSTIEEALEELDAIVAAQLGYNGT